MNPLLVQFLTLPSIVISALFGAVGGAIGAGIAVVLSKTLKSPNKAKNTRIVVLVSTVLFIQIYNVVIPPLQKQELPIHVIDQIKEQRLFALIFKLHPEAENEMLAKLTEIINTGPNDQVGAKTQVMVAEFVEKNFNEHLVTASDDATYKMLQHNAEVIKMFADKPEVCVGYYLGKPKFSPEDLKNDFITKELNTKADIIESSVGHPSVTPKATDIQDVLKIIVGGYQQKGYSLDNLKKVGQVATLPPEEGCKIATELSEVMASLDEKDSVYVFKNLLYLAGQSPPK